MECTTEKQNQLPSSNLCRCRTEQSSASLWDIEHRKHRQTIFSGLEIESIGSASRGTISCCTKQIPKGVGMSYCQSWEQPQFNWVHYELRAVPHLEQPKLFSKVARLRGDLFKQKILTLRKPIQQTPARSRRQNTSSFWHSEANPIPATGKSQSHKSLIFQLNSHTSKCKTLWQFSSIIYNNFPSETTIWSAITPVFQERGLLARDHSYSSFQHLELDCSGPSWNNQVIYIGWFYWRCSPSHVPLLLSPLSTQGLASSADSSLTLP